MAGYGTRLRPHTWSRPKQLIRMAEKTVLDHVLDTFSSLPEPEHSEFIFIVGYLGDKIESHMRLTYPNLNVRYVDQSEMRGQSHAISLAKDYLSGPLLVLYADTLIETDLSFLTQEKAGAVAWVKAVPDPRRFGVASVGEDGWVTHLVEKPKEINNNLAVVGCYYFQSSEELQEAIEEQVRRDTQLKGEFFLTDAINIMLERGLKMRVEHVETWLDGGTPDDVLNTNRYLLEHGHDNTAESSLRSQVVVIPPVYIHPSATVENSVIGPHAVIGSACQVNRCIIRDSIVDDFSQVMDVVMEHSLIGQEVHIQRRAGILNVGDHTELTL
jgi:glucose-1-phosphate thymidylyltransferase